MPGWYFPFQVPQQDDPILLYGLPASSASLVSFASLPIEEVSLTSPSPEQRTTPHRGSHHRLFTRELA